MVVLIDLDGTLTNTADIKFKPFKDGLEILEINRVPLFEGAIDFINKLKSLGHIPIIVSDSHPKYVNSIAREIFNIQAVSLTDKPNYQKTLDFIQQNTELNELFDNKDNFIMIGDSWLDIELGRRLGIATILTKFYKATSIDERDGIGQDWKPLKSGPTFYANCYKQVLKIIENPIDNLLAIESVFQNGSSAEMVRFKFKRSENGFIAFRCLARQEDGECDRFARADKYFQIDNPERDSIFLNQLAEGINNYLKRVESYPEYHWDLITYVSDKKTTKPPNKLKEIFDLVKTNIPKQKIFKWSENVEGNLRNQPDYQSRKSFIGKFLSIEESIDVSAKNIIIIDDQFTSSATAYEICRQLRNSGPKNILFIALFYLILPVSNKNCPHCGQPLALKIKKSDGSKFYSCVPPQFKGNGCGFIENLV